MLFFAFFLIWGKKNVLVLYYHVTYFIKVYVTYTTYLTYHFIKVGKANWHNTNHKNKNKKNNLPLCGTNFFFFFVTSALSRSPALPPWRAKVSWSSPQASGVRTTTAASSPQPMTQPYGGGTFAPWGEHFSSCLFVCLFQPGPEENFRVIQGFVLFCFSKVYIHIFWMTTLKFESMRYWARNITEPLFHWMRISGIMRFYCIEDFRKR